MASVGRVHFTWPWPGEGTLGGLCRARALYVAQSGDGTLCDLNLVRIFCDLGLARVLSGPKDTLW